MATRVRYVVRRAGPRAWDLVRLVCRCRDCEHGAVIGTYDTRREAKCEAKCWTIEDILATALAVTS
jgi:hypothetical protein